MSDTDLELLQRYSRDRVEDAFAEIVRRHLGLVHSAALRQVRSPQLAEEVAQSVFTDLARNTTRLQPDTILTAWLYQVTRRTAIDVVRRESRRQMREQIATEMNAMNAATTDWTHIEPLLDEAMSALDETDRAAVLLRYFQNKSLREVGATLGTSDDAAQKRVGRAVERLRDFFAKRGVTVGANGLAVIISANAVQAAPLGLAVTISTAAALAGTTLATTTIATHTTMNWLNIKSITAIGAAAIAASTGTHLVKQNEANRLRSENQNLIAQQIQLTNERDSAFSTTTVNNEELQRSRTERSDLLRLRSEVGMLREEQGQLGKLRSENLQLRTALTDATQKRPQPESDAAGKQVSATVISKLNTATMFGIAMTLYADQNQQQLPTNFDQLVPYWGGISSQVLSELSLFEIVVRGTAPRLLSPTAGIVIREKKAWQTDGGKWGRAYGFADGHSEIRYEPDGNFTVWEKEHMAPLPPNEK